MEPTRRFKDEWLVKAILRTFPTLSEFVHQALLDEKPFLSLAVREANLLRFEDLALAVKETYRVDSILPEAEDIQKPALSLVSEKVCRRHQIIPLSVTHELLYVAMACPVDLEVQSVLQALTGRRIVPLYCPPERIETILSSFHNPNLVACDLLDRMEKDPEWVSGRASASEQDGGFHSDLAPVIRLMNAILARAVRSRASDIHIEHEERASLVRFRIDGLLKNVMALPKYLAAGPMVSRIKIMANLDVAEHFRPQDGRVKVLVDGAEIGLRVSTLPTHVGEKVVIRILDERTGRIPLERMGFPPSIASQIRTLIAREQGMFLVTGPTGSGKTTTLYALLNALKSERTNIVTVEDPVEFKLPGINQVHVNEKQGLTFSSVLRSVLRQDPDIIMIGEIRDRDTAEIAVQAALTGHLVFSTVHANSTLATVTRLMDMGVEEYKIGTALIAVTAQRLVRRLCEECRELIPMHRMDPDVRSALRAQSVETRYYAPRGCPKCELTGYRGRVSLIELLEIDQVLRDRIGAGAGAEELRQHALRTHALRPLLQDVLWHLSQGDTSLEEVLPYLDLAEFFNATRQTAEPRPPEPLPEPGVLEIEQDLPSIVSSQGIMKKAAPFSLSL
ncbi:MAG: type II/IV secretion system protein [Elusimicrobia bacterium]|nr:type II/IV secretion system protein [Elusimicrobiota bacterium]